MIELLSELIIEKLTLGDKLTEIMKLSLVWSVPNRYIETVVKSS